MADSVDDTDGVGLGVGFTAMIFLDFQINFLPDFVQVKTKVRDFMTCPALLQVLPAEGCAACVIRIPITKVAISTNTAPTRMGFIPKRSLFTAAFSIDIRHLLKNPFKQR